MKLVQLVYVAIAVGAVFLTWKNNLAFFAERAHLKEGPLDGFAEFFRLSFVNRYTTLHVLELLAVAGTVAVSFKADGLRLGVKYPALYLFLSLFIAISAFAPLFLAVSHRNRSRMANYLAGAPKLNFRDRFPFSSSLVYLVVTSALFGAMSFVAPLDSDFGKQVFFYLFLVSYIVAPYIFILSPGGIGYGSAVPLSPTDSSNIRSLFGIAAGIGLMCLVSARVPLFLDIAQGSITTDPAAVWSLACANFAAASIAWDYLFLALSYLVFVLVEPSYFVGGVLSRLAWLVFFVVALPVALPLYLMSTYSEPRVNAEDAKKNN